MSNSIKLTAEAAVKRMKVAEGIYFLNAGFEKRMSTISQQMRAISLIGTLLDMSDPESGFRIKKEDPIAIIGAGVAGITAAVLAAWRGCKYVHIFEKTSKVASTFEESQRLIHPRLYEWGVEKDWNLDTAAIPLLDWEQKSGEEVVKLIREQWKYWLDYYGAVDSAARRIYFHENCEFDEKSLFKDFDVLREQFATEFRLLCAGSNEKVKFRTEVSGFKAIILATGFGDRTKPKWISENTDKFKNGENAYIYDYWSEIPTFNEGKKIAVVGGNDSGLTEAIELAAEIKLPDGEYKQLKQDNLPILLKLLEDDEGNIRTRFNEIKENYANEIQNVKNDAKRIEVEFKFFDQIRQIKSEKLKELIKQNKLSNNHLITLFTRNKNKDNTPYLPLSSFPLNLFLISHFMDAGWVILEYCKNAHDIKIDEDGKYVIPKSDKKFDYVLFRLGTEKAKSVENFAKIFKDKLKAQGFEHSSGNISLDIARKEPEKNQTGEWLFASDLFDSFTQRQVLTELAKEKEKNKIENAEKELVNLYEKRLYLEILRRGKVVFVDTQILDGCFFLRWLNYNFSKFSDEDKKFLSERIIIKMRGKVTTNNTDKANSCLNEYSFVNKTYKFFRFSYLSDESADMLDMFNPDKLSERELLEDDVTECFENFPEKLTFEMWSEPEIEKAKEKKCTENEINDLKEKLLSKFPDKKKRLLEEWKKFLNLHKRLYEKNILDTFKIKHFPNTEDQPWDQYSAFEDPALFAMSLEEKVEESLLVLQKMFRKTEKGKDPNRTEVFKWVDEKFLVKTTIENQRLKNYFSRAYYRTVARQHGANIFETINVSETCFPDVENTPTAEDRIKKLWKYTYRDNKSNLKSVEEKEWEKSIESVGKLRSIFKNDDYDKGRKEQHIKISSKDKASTSKNPINIGQRALAVLRGSNVEIKRMWVEEALKVGAQIPAVVDEERLNDNTVLSRIEYKFNLPYKESDD